MSDRNSTPGTAGTTSSRRLQFGLTYVVYVVSLVAACLAAFGAYGTWLAVVALAFWTAVLTSRSRPAAFRNASFVLVGGLCIVGFLLPVTRNAGGAARRVQYVNNLKQITLALLNYHDSFGAFPPAFVADSHGNRLHSWRVLLLPFVDEKSLYDKYNFDEPWDGPTNSKLLSQMPAVYACPEVMRNGQPTTASYLAVVGQGTAWPGNSARRLKDYTDGVADTLLIVECPEQKVPWLQPADLDFDQALDLFTKHHSAERASRGHLSWGRNVSFADGRIRLIAHGVTREVWSAILTVADGAAWIEEDLDRPPSEQPLAWLGDWARYCGLVVVLLFPIRWIFRLGTAREAHH